MKTLAEYLTSRDWSAWLGDLEKKIDEGKDDYDCVTLEEAAYEGFHTVNNILTFAQQDREALAFLIRQIVTIKNEAETVCAGHDRDIAALVATGPAGIIARQNEIIHAQRKTLRHLLGGDFPAITRRLAELFSLPNPIATPAVLPAPAPAKKGRGKKKGAAEPTAEPEVTPAPAPHGTATDPSRTAPVVTAAGGSVNAFMEDVTGLIERNTIGIGEVVSALELIKFNLLMGSVMPMIESRLQAVPMDMMRRVIARIQTAPEEDSNGTS